MKILIFQPMLKQYRVPLFDRMRDQLVKQGHQLRVVCGSPPPSESTKGDNIYESNDFCLIEKSHWLFNGKIHFLHNALNHIFWADFIITEQANKHIHNYLLIVFRIIGYKRFAYWGHGQNRQGDSKSWPEKMKKCLIAQCDWWFAYTEGVAKYVATLGFPASKITALNNSIDTSEFRQLLSKQTPENIEDFKLQLGLESNTRIGIYCGSLYADKKIQFLLTAAKRIHEHNSAFVLIIVGDGKDRPLVEEFTNHHRFVRYLGPLFGEPKALAFKSAELFLCPGLVGLAILDAFTAALPLFTTDIPNHSPEIEYLEQDFNGIMTPALEEVYATSVLNALATPQYLLTLQNNAQTSSSKFSIENMANNFVLGINNYVEAASRN